MSRLMWIGLAGLATLGGIAFHSIEEVNQLVEVADYAIGEDRATFLEEMERLEADIESGRVSEELAVEEAIERLIERASGIDPNDADDTPSVSLTLGSDRSGPGRSFDQAIRETRDRFERIETLAGDLYADGKMSEDRFNETIETLAMAERKISELRDDGPQDALRAEIDAARAEAQLAIDEAREEARAVVEESRASARASAEAATR